MKFSFLYGARVSTLVRLMREHGVDRDAWPALAPLALTSLANSVLARPLPKARVVAPVFVLGHWRSGTTHLQYLLSRDPVFHSPSTFEVCFPHRIGRVSFDHRALARILPERRLQDAMAFGADVPNEDEIALAALGAPSPYRYWAFADDKTDHLRWLSFRDATAVERRAFTTALDAYLGALSAAHPRKRLLLKSPAHTARIALLRGLYPDAKFVHVHRHPYEVFASTRHLHRVWNEHTAFLTSRAERDSDARILRVYRALHDAYFDDAAALAPNELHTIRYDDLVRDPMATLEATYAALDLGPFAPARFESYLSTVEGFTKNRYHELGRDDRTRARAAAARVFETFGYDAYSGSKISRTTRATAATSASVAILSVASSHPRSAATPAQDSRTESPVTRLAGSTLEPSQGVEQREPDEEEDAGDERAGERGFVMAREVGLERGGQEPHLHDEHDGEEREDRVEPGESARSPASRVVHASSPTPIATSSPSLRASRMRTSGRGGGPCSTSPVRASK